MTAFQETEDGRYLITLSGVSRFRLGEMQEGFAPYLRARVDWSSFERDLGRAETRPGASTGRRSSSVLARFFDTAQLSLGLGQPEGGGGRAPDQLAVDPLPVRPGGEAGAARGADARQPARDAGDADGVRAALGRRRGGDPVRRSPVDLFSPPADPGATVPHSRRGFVRRQIRARLPAFGQARFRAYPRHARADYERSVPAAPPSASALARSSRRTGATQCVASAGSGGLSCHRAEAARRGGMPPVIRIIQPVIV